MRLCLICWGLLALAACGRVIEVATPIAPPVPADLRRPCPGWQGAPPITQGQLVRAVVAEVAGRRCANAKIAAIDAILTGAALDSEKLSD